MQSKRRFIQGAAASAATVLGTGLVLVAPAGAAPTTTTSTTLAPPGQSITTIAGNGTGGYSGDGGPAVKAELNLPTGVGEDLSGNLYIGDSANNRVREVKSPTMINTDTISTFAGTGSGGYSGDGGPATNAKLSAPTGIAVGPNGWVYIADTGNNRVRVVKSGIISTLAGNGSCSSKVGDGGSATSASLCAPTGVTVDSAGDVFIADSVHSEIRKVNTAGTISDYAGTGSFGYSGDGGAATKAKLGLPVGVALDSAKDLYIADSAYSVVREVTATGTIKTFAGTGSLGYSGDGGPATKAKLSAPTGLGVDSLGDVFISDSGNNRIREVNTGGTISTYAGNGTRGFSGDGGPANKAQLNTPTGSIVMDGKALYFSDTGNQRVRGVFNGPPPVLPETAVAILLPLGGVAVLGGAFVLARRRRRQMAAIAVVGRRGAAQSAGGDVASTGSSSSSSGPRARHFHPVSRGGYDDHGGCLSVRSGVGDGVDRQREPVEVRGLQPSVRSAVPTLQQSAGVLPR